MDWYSDVFDIIFPRVDADAANSVWEKQLKEPEKERKKRRSKSARFEDEESGDDD